jgi:hypothetical protein
MWPDCDSGAAKFSLAHLLRLRNACGFAGAHTLAELAVFTGDSYSNTLDFYRR